MGGEARWFCASTQPNKERFVITQLENQGFGAFCPLYWRTTRHARQFRKKRRALFPQYIFVNLDLGRDRWRSVNGTFGVTRLIMSGEYPTPVPVGFVEHLQNNTADDLLRADFEALTIGDQVRIGFVFCCRSWVAAPRLGRRGRQSRSLVKCWH